MQRIYGFILKWFGLKYMVAGYNSLEGYKSQIGMVLGIIVFLARAFNKVTDQQASELYAGIGVWTGKSFIDKLNRYQQTAAEIALDVQKQQSKQGSGEGASPSTPTPASPQ